MFNMYYICSSVKQEDMSVVGVCVNIHACICSSHYFVFWFFIFLGNNSIGK
jgi:hypothetical protein